MTVAAVMCHALSRKSRDTHFRDQHRCSGATFITPALHRPGDVQSSGVEESEADLKLRITMTHEEG